MNRDCTLAFFIGLATGAMFGVLCAPRSGEDFRRSIATGVKSRSDEVKDQAAGLWDSATGLVDKGHIELVRQQEGLKNAVAAGKQAYAEMAG